MIKTQLQTSSVICWKGWNGSEVVQWNWTSTRVGVEVKTRLVELGYCIAMSFGSELKTSPVELDFCLALELELSMTCPMELLSRSA